jgi:hypothetical protein
MCLDDFAIPELNWSDNTETLGDWTAEGFALVNNKIPQDYLVLAVRQPVEGTATVIQLPVDGDGEGLLALSDVQKDEKVVLIVSPVTAGVAGAASYSLTVDKSDAGSG